MKSTPRYSSAFSLVEVTLALGVAALCLIAVLGMLPVAVKTQQIAVQQTTANAIISEVAADLRAATRLPPGQMSKQFGLNAHWVAATSPSRVYFTNDAIQTGSTNSGTTPTDATLRATISYLAPPTGTSTTSLARIKVSWPAAADPNTDLPAGSVEALVAINR